ncbi:MAG TPA: molybdenum cofactor guanylyltransferase [Thermoplasmatales archaeon]|nr:molybdenum cofactor guanylyltransferase [Thermoplasmatales archaeon]
MRDGCPNTLKRFFLYPFRGGFTKKLEGIKTLDENTDLEDRICYCRAPSPVSSQVFLSLRHVETHNIGCVSLHSLNVESSICGFILGGGDSTRLGFDKCFLEIDGRRVIDIIAENLSSIFGRVVIVAKNPKKFIGYEVWLDIHSLRSALYGLYTVLSLSNFNWNFVTGCDMPFLNKNLLKYVVSVALSYDYKKVDVVTPVIHNHFEPLFAVYSRNAYGKLCRYIKDGGRSLQGFIEETRFKVVSEDEIRIYDPDLLSFFNVNTPRDLITMNKLLRMNKFKSMVGGLG